MGFTRTKKMFWYMGVVLLFNIGCSNDNPLKSSSRVITTSSQTSSGEPQYVEPAIVKKIQKILNNATREEKQEFISKYMNVKETKGKKVSICMYYDGVTDNHWCDRAEFYVFLNKTSSGGTYDPSKAESKILNINNFTPRTVKGIKTHKNHEVGPDQTAQDNYTKCTRAKNADVTECHKDLIKLLRVPGTKYTTKWNKEGKVEIVTTCSFPKGHQYYNRCHDGTIGMSTIGSFVVDYEGETAEVKFIDKRGIIKNNVAVTYDIADQDFEIVTEDKEFNDWCDIK